MSAQPKIDTATNGDGDSGRFPILIEMEREETIPPLKSVVEPGTLRQIGLGLGTHTVFIYDDSARQYTDAALLNYCGADSYNWGRVDRSGKTVRVIVHSGN